MDILTYVYSKTRKSSETPVIIIKIVFFISMRYWLITTVENQTISLEVLGSIRLSRYAFDQVATFSPRPEYEDKPTQAN